MHLCLIVSHTEKRLQPLLFSDIRLQWEPDVFSVDMNLMSTALTAHSREAGINSFRLSVSEGGACSPLNLHQPVVNHHAPDDNRSNH